MSDTNGTVSHIIGNMTMNNEQLRRMGASLPPGVNVTQPYAAIAQDVQALKDMQEKTLQFCRAAAQYLGVDAVRETEARNFDEAVRAVRKAGEAAEPVKSAVETSLAAVQAGSVRLTLLAETLNAARDVVQVQRNAAQAAYEEAKSNVDKFTKEKYYYLALGPFGVAGLAAAIAMLDTWNAKLNTVAAQANALQQDLNTIAAYTREVQGLQMEYSRAQRQVSYIRNDVGVITTDLQRAIDDLGKASPSGFSAFYLSAARSSVQALEMDAG